jgi:predicted ATP-grasp superfamily ATP-dependent carboligase
MSACRVLVTDGESRAALASVRALGARGHGVHVVSADGRSLAGASRHALSDRALGDPATDPAGWARALERAAAEVRADLVLPLGEVSLGCMYAFDLASRIPVACPDADAYAAVTDKHALLARAATLGIAIPRGLLVEAGQQRAELPAGLGYPVVVKPRRSRWLEGGRWCAGDARIASGPAELEQALAVPHAGMLVQEYVPGKGEGIFLLAHRGRTLVRFSHRRIREKPPTGGVSVLRESIEPDPVLLAAAEALLANLDWSGVAMTEFRRAPDGRAFLMEVNPRLWGSLQVALDAGVDFPSLLVDLARGEPIAEVRPRIGVRSRWLLGDLDHLLISLRRPQVRRLTGARVPTLLLDFVRGFCDGSRDEVFRRDDSLPFLHEVRARLRP